MRTLTTLLAFLIGLSVAVPDALADSSAGCFTTSGDTDGNGIRNVVDVQCGILLSLWALTSYKGAVPTCAIGSPFSPALAGDHNCDGKTDVTDVLLSIHFALNEPPPAELDSDNNGVVDACEIDADLDGVCDPLDCSATDPTVSNLAAEKCNGYDDNCNGEIDETWDMDTSCDDNNGCTQDGTCKPFPAGLTLLIHEFLPDPLVPDDHGEWIELMNASTEDILLGAWSLENASGQQVVFPPQAFVNAGSYIVLERVPTPSSPGTILKSIPYTNFEMGDQNDALVLRNPQGAVVDEVEYDPVTFPISQGAAVALSNPTVDNAVGENWKPSAVVGSSGWPGTPGAPNSDVAAEFCGGGLDIACEDCNPCTDDVCDPLLGCVFTPNNGTCSDGDPLTIGDQCLNGTCQSGAPKNCDDGVACTVDVPDILSVTGCSHIANPAKCDDGVACTLDLCDVAKKGCVHEPQNDKCGDGYACTADVCNLVTGCQHTAINCAVNTVWIEDQHSPKIAPLDPGQGACVVWLWGNFGYTGQPAVSKRIRMQCYDKNFVPLGGNIEVRNIWGLSPYAMVNHVDIASSTGNRVAVVWEEYETGYSGLWDGDHSIMAKIYQCDPVVTKTCFQVYPTVPPQGTSDQGPGGVISDDTPANVACAGQDPTDDIWPAVAAGPADDFVVAWGAGRKHNSVHGAAIQLRVRRLSNVGPVGPAYELGNYPGSDGCAKGLDNLQLATHPNADCIAIKWRSDQSTDSKTYLAVVPKNNIASVVNTPVVEALGKSPNHDHWDITMNDNERLFIAHQMNNGQLGVKWYAQACDDLNNDSDVGDTGPLLAPKNDPTPRITALPSEPLDNWKLFAMTYLDQKNAFSSFIYFSTNASTYQVNQMSQYKAHYNQQGDITFTGTWVAAVTHAYLPDGDGLGVFLFVCDPDDATKCWMPLPP